MNWTVKITNANEQHMNKENIEGIINHTGSQSQVAFILSSSTMPTPLLIFYIKISFIYRFTFVKWKKITCNQLGLLPNWFVLLFWIWDMPKGCKNIILYIH